MYARTKVAWRLDQASAELSITPEYHSIAEVEAFEDHLQRGNFYHFDTVGKPDSLVNLTAFESAWIANEQLLVLCDAAYALTRYCYIKDEQNIIRRYEHRVPQRILYDIICELDASDRTLEFIILKARQLGMSTLIELLIGLRIIFGYGVNAVIGSADPTKTALMANMLFLMYDYFPVWLRPQWTRRVESERGMLVFGHSSSGVSFQHGSQTSGIARGTTPTIYHLSEVASYTNAEDQIESSLFRCVHPSPSVLGFLESSGRAIKAGGRILGGPVATIGLYMARGSARCSSPGSAALKCILTLNGSPTIILSSGPGARTKTPASTPRNANYSSARIRCWKSICSLRPGAAPRGRCLARSSGSGSSATKRRNARAPRASGTRKCAPTTKKRYSARRTPSSATTRSKC